MVASTDPRQSAAEKIVATSIKATWLLWFIGGLYVAGPVLGWVLFGMAVWRYYSAPNLPPEQRPPVVPLIVWLWMLGMAAMLVALWAGHSNFSLGTGQTIKSTIGWAKGWALIALFIFVGATMRIRPEVIYRAMCQLGKQTLWLLPLFIAAPFVGLPETLWVSPLKAIGGPGPEYFATVLYTIEPGVGTPRWQFMAPWSPAAGMVAVIYILCAIEERDIKLKIIGIAGGLAIALLSQSRLALVALAVVWPLAHGFAMIRRPALWFAAAPLSLGVGLFAVSLMEKLIDFQAQFAGARADSSRVRAALGRIAVERWRNEAPIFGHGVVERGPHLVEYMPIGSHHSWYGLLFVKGIVGLFSLAIPLIATLAVLAVRASAYPHARVGLSMAIVLGLYTFGENLEILAYLFWPALILIGAGLAAPVVVVDAESDPKN